MKTFKQFFKNKKIEIPSIESPIHFKHVKSDDYIKSIPEPIHFKHVKKKNKSLKEDFSANKTKKTTLSSWFKKNDNKEHGKDSDEISEKIKKDNFNDDHKDAIGKYAKSSKTINEHLIKTGNKPNSIFVKKSEVLDDAIDKNRIDHKLHVYSGVSFNPEKLKNKDGHFKSPAYISTTHDKKVAHMFASDPDHGDADSNNESHIIHFHLKPGDPAAHISHHSPHYEHETLIKRGVTLHHSHSEKIHDEDNPHLPFRIHHVTIHNEKD